MKATPAWPTRRPLVFERAVAAALAARRETIVVLGGGGWLGLAAQEMLWHALGPAFADRVRVFGSRRRTLELRNGAVIVCGGPDDLAALPRGPALLLHFAFLTRDRVAGMAPEAYVAANRAISDTAFRLAEALPATGIFMPSSGAVYGPQRRLDRDLARNPYGALKLEDEDRVRELGARIGARVVVPRVFNLSGPYINKVETYAIASIIHAVLQRAPVVLRADRPVIRSYVSVGDLISLCMAALFEPGPEPLVRFDTAGVEEIEVGGLAARVCAVLGRGELEIRRPPLVPGREPDRYVGDCAKITELTARHGMRLHPLEDQIRDTAADLATRLATVGP